MKPVKGKWVRTNLVALLAAGFGFAAPAANDPFLLLGPPSFVSNRVHFTITGEADAGYVVEASADSRHWTPVATNADTNITRVLTLQPSTNAVFCRAWRKGLPVFAGALVAKEFIDFRGNGAGTDSFDSSDPRYSTAGVYDPLKRLAGGDVSSILGSVNVGSARINGKLRTGTTGNFSLGANGLVGPLDWEGPGICPGWYRKDFRFVLPDLSPPYTNGLPPMASGTNSYVLGSGDYYFPGNLAMNNQIMLVTGNSRLYVKGSFNMSGGGSEIKITPGASLQLCVGGANAVITRVNAMDPVANAWTFQYYGLSSNTNLAWSANQALTGTIYAPAAKVTLGGGGMDVYDFQGACAASSIVLNGHFNIHFDENLAKSGPQR